MAEKLIKAVKEQTRTEKGKFINGKQEKDKVVVLNRNISFYDHNGRVRHYTEDEARLMQKNLNDMISELDSEVKGQ